MAKKYSNQNFLPNINYIFKGKIVTVKDFGVFVEIPDCSKNGLVHRSQISRGQVDQVSEVASVGDVVWCKVISIANDDKIGLSMKVVDQGDGKDLDPNGVNFSLDEKKRRSSVPHSQKKIQLDAVYNTTCKKCGTKGHLAQDCFHTPGGKSYELLTDDLNVKSENNQKELTTKEKKRKHESDSESESSVDSKEKHKRKKDKHKSKKKKKKKKSHKK